MDKRLVLKYSDTLEEMRIKIEAFHYELLTDCIGIPEPEIWKANTKAFAIYTAKELMGGRTTAPLRHGRFFIYFCSQSELEFNMSYYNDLFVRTIVEDTDDWKDLGKYPYDYVCPNCNNKLVQTGFFRGGLFIEHRSWEAFLCLFCMKAFRKEVHTVMTGKTSGPFDWHEVEHREMPLVEIPEPDFKRAIQ